MALQVNLQDVSTSSLCSSSAIIWLDLIYIDIELIPRRLVGAFTWSVQNYSR